MHQKSDATHQSGSDWWPRISDRSPSSRWSRPRQLGPVISRCGASILCPAASPPAFSFKAAELTHLLPRATQTEPSACQVCGRRATRPPSAQPLGDRRGYFVRRPQGRGLAGELRKTLSTVRKLGNSQPPLSPMWGNGHLGRVPCGRVITPRGVNISSPALRNDAGLGRGAKKSGPPAIPWGEQHCTLNQSFKQPTHTRLLPCSYHE